MTRAPSASVTGRADSSAWPSIFVFVNITNLFHLYIMMIIMVIIFLRFKTRSICRGGIRIRKQDAHRSECDAEVERCVAGVQITNWALGAASARLRRRSALPMIG